MSEADFAELARRVTVTRERALAARAASKLAEQHYADSRGVYDRARSEYWKAIRALTGAAGVPDYTEDELG